MGFWARQKESFEAEVKVKEAVLRGEAGEFDYLGGHPHLKSGKIVVWKGQTPNTLLLEQKFTNDKTKHEVTVTKLEWDEKGKRSAGSAAAGAIIGGVLTGGVGLLAGAAIGGRKKDNSLAVMTYNIGVVESAIYFRADMEDFQKLAKLLV